MVLCLLYKRELLVSTHIFTTFALIYISYDIQSTLPVNVEEAVLDAEVVAPKVNNPVLEAAVVVVVVAGETTFVFPKLNDAPVKDGLVDVTSGGFLAPNENMFEGATGATIAEEEVVVVKPIVLGGLSDPNLNDVVGVLEKLNPPLGVVVVDGFVDCPKDCAAGENPVVERGDDTPGFPRLN